MKPLIYSYMQVTGGVHEAVMPSLDRLSPHRSRPSPSAYQHQRTLRAGGAW